MGVNRSTNSEQGKISSCALSVAHPASEMSKGGKVLYRRLPRILTNLDECIAAKTCKKNEFLKGIDNANK